MEGSTEIMTTPGVCGGYPRIGQTRIRVGSVVRVYRLTGDDFARTVAAWPQLTRAQVRAALDYYQIHPQLVDEDIARNEQALAAIHDRR
ncbi:MAG TPA: DUF433 domain-containing protein [Thermomicrobiales bacterium]|nr:DUF433 domain-containing protein [Thermomicrobiales bacterium]